MPSAILAYIDPGTGSILLQVLIGSVVGVFIMFRQSVAHMVSWLRGGRRRNEAVSSPAADESTQV
jgi:hypothetical protein